MLSGYIAAAVQQQGHQTNQHHTTLQWLIASHVRNTQCLPPDIGSDRM
jgi:hypothetical protein